MSGGFIQGIGVVLMIVVLIARWRDPGRGLPDERLAADAAVWDAIARRDLYGVQSGLVESSQVRPPLRDLPPPACGYCGNADCPICRGSLN